MARQSDDGMARFEALKLVAPSLNVERPGRCVGPGRGRRDGWFRSRGAGGDRPALALMPPDVLRPLWRDWLREQAPGKRPELCRDLAAMMPVVTALGGPEAVMGLARAVRDVGRWWP